eukprot:1296074-Amphidinium_carterae.1
MKNSIVCPGLRLHASYCNLAQSNLSGAVCPYASSNRDHMCVKPPGTSMSSMDITFNVSRAALFVARYSSIAAGARC